MDHRGHHWPDAGRHSHRAKDRGGHSRYSQQERDQSYPPPDLRERDRQGRPDARYMAHFPPARPEQYPYSSQQYLYAYGPEYQRPLSRHGYEYSPHSHWDYNYGYYDYYSRQHGRQDGGQWGPQDSWRADQYHERGHSQGHPGNLYTEEYRYDHGRDNSHHYLNDSEDNPSRDNEEISSYYLGTLESSKNSGLSSSSYELSQYMNGAEHSDPAPQPHGDHAPAHQMSAPLKYSIPHAVVSFGPAGQLIRVTAGLSAQENVSHLEIHSLEVILSETQEQQEMRNFPGPLTREDLHKVDAIEFAHQMAGACMRDNNLQDRSSAALLWNLLILLCRQNGQIVGSDITELLMQGSHSDGSCPSDAPTLIDFNEDSTAEAPPGKGDDLLTGNWSSFSSENSEKALQTYTQLLLAGRKKEALESAMTNGLWGHALFLASKMDNRSYTTVLNRFTAQLMPSDPLQTLFQLLSGRIPAVVTCCGNEKWGDWRPHLAVMLSNETGDPSIQQKAIITMGETLASRGLIHAAHVCYLTASVPFGVFTQKAERLVLLGSSHRKSFECFATNAAIQCTELYEYCQTLGGKNFSIPSFQVYKFLYASRLLDCGLSSLAFHYCEVIGQALLRQKEPFFVLTGEVVKLSDRLRHSEGQLSGAGLGGAGKEPEWLKCLRARYHSLQEQIHLKVRLCNTQRNCNKTRATSQTLQDSITTGAEHLAVNELTMNSLMGTFDESEGYQPTSENSAMSHEVPSDSDLDDLSHDIQSPEPELLYYRGPEDHESPMCQSGEDPEEMTVMSWGVREPQDWPQSNSPANTVMEVYTPPEPTVAPSQNFSHHNTDSCEVTSASQHCPPSYLPSVAEGDEASSGARTMGSQMSEVDFSRPGQSQQIFSQGLEASVQTTEPPEQSTKKGWFSGWFKSKPKEAQKQTSERGGSAQTALSPSAGLCPPPPPASAPPGMCPSQPSTAGINPFSRKAGKQLG